MMLKRSMKGGFWLVFLGLLAIFALVGCSALGGEEAGSEIPEIVIEATDSGLTVPAEVPSGVVAFTIPSEGDAIPARLNEGVTADQVSEALTQPDPLAALSLVSLLGSGSNTVDGKLIASLKPGQHVVVSFPENGPPAAYPFNAGEDSGAVAPVPDITVDLVDFNFAIPSEIESGPKVWQINNKGTQWHEMGIMKLAEGTTIDDIMAMFDSEEPTEGPPPFEEVVFWAPNSPGETGYVTWDLPPGEYTVICFLPDLAGDMSPHATHGMVAELTVTE